MKRFFLFLMVLMLLAGTAVAEGALPVVQDKLTLTVLKEVRDIDTLTPDNNAAVKKLEELTNVHAEYLDVVKQSDWNTKLSLTLASGELRTLSGPAATSILKSTAQCSSWLSLWRS